MSKFNVKSIAKTILNYEGAPAFQQSPEMELLSVLLTSFATSQFYRSEAETYERIIELLAQLKDKKFAAKAAVYARTQFGMRSITHVLAAEIAHTVKGATWTKSFFDKIIYRPDDMMEILAYYLNKYGKPIPNSMKKGFQRAFGRFNEYELAKYRKDYASVSLIDIVNIVRPVPQEGNREALQKLVADKLRSFDTWESEVTKAGQDADVESVEEKKKDAWTKLVSTKKIGYFALLRNLRNILLNAPEVLDEALAMLVEEKRIRKSLVLPFRYMTAIEEIEKENEDGVRKILTALNNAVDISLSNVPQFKGRNLIALDVSGSMMGKPIKIGSLFASVLYKTNDSDLMLFSDDAQYISLNPGDSTLTLAKSIYDYSFKINGGTNFHAIFESANKAYDRIFILSDMQGWVGPGTPVKVFEEYRRNTGADPFVYSIDLQGYGSLQFPQRKIFCLAGFSEKLFDVMGYLEKDQNAFIQEVEKIEL